MHPFSASPLKRHGKTRDFNRQNPPSLRAPCHFSRISSHRFDLEPAWSVQSCLHVWNSQKTCSIRIRYDALFVLSIFNHSFPVQQPAQIISNIFKHLKTDDLLRCRRPSERSTFGGVSARGLGHLRPWSLGRGSELWPVTLLRVSRCCCLIWWKISYFMWFHMVWYPFIWFDIV